MKRSNPYGIRASRIRPWEVGDECRVVFGRRRTSPVGCIVAIFYGIKNGTPDVYCQVSFYLGDGGIYPAFQLIPAGITGLTWRHLKFTFRKK
jgi:hypothetical protein